MFGDVRGCARARSYEECQRHFNLTPKPVYSRGGHDPWEEYQRPLDDKTKHHYRLSRGPNEAYYDVVLYNTVMARYYAPAEGGRRVCYNSDSRQLSSQFMWRVTDSGKVMGLGTTDGKILRVPVGPGSRYGNTFGADLTFVDGKLDVARSSHQEVSVFHTSDSLKAWRKEVRIKMADFFALMRYRAAKLVEEYVAPAAANVYNHPGSLRGMDSTKYNKWKLTNIRFNPLTDLTEAAVPILIAMYDERVERCLDVRDYRELGMDVGIVAKAAERACLREIDACFVGNSTKEVVLPQFPDELPKEFHFR